jgi:hypothetical protein
VPEVAAARYEDPDFAFPTGLTVEQLPEALPKSRSEAVPKKEKPNSGAWKAEKKSVPLIG